MPSTSYTDATMGVSTIGARTDSAGTGVTDWSSSEARLVNTLVTEGYLTADAFVVAADSPASMDVIVGSGTSGADAYVVAGDDDGQGNYLCRLDSSGVTVTLDAADASNGRIDEVWLVVLDNVYDSSGLALARIAYRKGDASASPSAPGADASWKAAVKLATVTVGAGVTSVGSGDVADNRTRSQLASILQTVTGTMTFESGIDLQYGANASNAPAAYPLGMSFDAAVAAADGFPLSAGARGLIVTVRGTSYAMQWLISDSLLGTMLVRQGDVSAGTWDGWSTLTAAESPGLWEVDDSTEVNDVTLTTSAASVASVTLSIPSDWNSWKCYASATFASKGDGAFHAVLRIDGTDQQEQELIEVGSRGSASVGGRRTGMTTSGSRTVSLRCREEVGSTVVVRDVFLYARAVRTS